MQPHTQSFVDQVLPVAVGYLLSKFGLTISSATLRKAAGWVTARILGGRR